MLTAIVGVAFGLAYIFLARLLRVDRWLFALGLISLPVVYSVFALYAGQRLPAALELAWGIPYLVGGMLLPLVRFRGSIALAGVLWLLHGGYDLLHGSLIGNAGVPDWYPVFCAAVDVVIGTYLLGLARGS